MERKEIVQALENCELFNGLSKEDSEKIASLCHVETYGPGEYIFRQGEPGERLYIIAQGRVFLERRLDLGPRKGNAVISILEKGRALGCWSTLLDETHALMTSASCQGKTKVVVVNGRDLSRMMMTNMGLGVNIYRKLCFLLRERLQGAFGAMDKI